MSFEKFTYIYDYNYEKGWDKFALNYSEKLQPNTVYALTKNLMYRIIDENIKLDGDSAILDIGCGTGNDFPYFLSKDAQITAFDRSTGMLNKASESYKNAIESSKINLHQGRLENLDEGVFSNDKFDLIYAITGGLSYIDDLELYRVFKLLKTMLKPNGRIITAHFNKLCLPEVLYNLIRLKFSRVYHRNKKKINVTIKGEDMIMYLRESSKIKRLLSNDFKAIKVYPLMAITPPYQTGFAPNKTVLNFFENIEMKILKKSYLTGVSDQFVIVLTND